MADDERAVSEALGFVLVFGIVVSTVAVVYVAGFDGLEAARDAEHANNAERAFDVLADNVDDVVLEGAPSRATEIKLADAEVRTGDPVVVNVTAADSTHPDRNASVEYVVDPVVYDAGDGGTIVYANGAVFRQQAGGSVMITEPAFVLGDRRVFVPVTQTRARAGGGVAGSTTVLVRTTRSFSETALANTTTTDVTVNITTPRATAWRRHLSARSGVTCPTADNSPTKVSCTVTDAERVYVTRVAVDFVIE